MEKLNLILVCPFHEQPPEHGPFGSDFTGSCSSNLLTPDRVSDYERMVLVTPVKTEDNQSSSST